MNLEAFEAGIVAAQKWLEACEYCVPRLNGDPQIIKEARSRVMYRTQFEHQAASRFKTATVEDFRVTFRDAKGTKPWE